MVRVVLVEDHPIFLEGLKAILAQHPEFDAAGTATTIAAGLDLITKNAPDVAVVDLGLPDGHGSDLIRRARLAGSHCRFLVLTSFDGDEDIYRALSAGAAGYLTKDSATEELADAVRTVGRGERYLPAEVRDQLVARLPRPELTDREREVLRLLAEGRKNRDIAQVLHLSELTVKVHVQNLLAKLDARDRTHAVRVALERGFVHLSDPPPST